MKKLITLLVICVVFVSCENETLVVEQACDNGTFVGNVTLTTQQEVNDWGALCYTKVNGTLNIGLDDNTNDDITDLSPLINLREIYTDDFDNGLGTLGIYSGNLTNLNGLNNITRVGRLRILNCHNLTTITGLENLRIINMDFPHYGLFIRGNQLLTSLDGLENLQRVGNDQIASEVGILITGNSQLANLDGLSGLIEVYGPLEFVFVNDFPSFISGNINLNDWCGLQNLFINGEHGPLINTATSFGGGIYEGFAPTVQDIIDGNCAQ
ncbi:MAG: hypothetical protein KJP09_01845 [Bacteroidia bacterium]|nr:hypothetical protein [Bacteroidia bacterium]